MSDMESLYRQLYEQARHDLVIERRVWRIITAFLIVVMAFFWAFIK